MRVSLMVNGKEYTTDVEQRTLLVDFLRDELGLTGTKVGCDTSQCGACVVLRDGLSVKSCTVLAVQAQSSAITTTEGLSDDAQLSPLQAQLWEAHGVQCGFCTPGLIVSLTDFLQHTDDPDETTIRAWLDGHICRCTGYQNVVRAVQQVIGTLQEASV